MFLFSAKLNELDLLKFKISSESELSGIIADNRTIYDERIKKYYVARFVMNMMYFYLVVFLVQNHFNVFIIFILNVLVIGRNGI